jgi:chromosome segregation ATPase
MTDSLQTPPRTAAALEARRKRSEAGLATVAQTVEQMLKARTNVTFAAVARQAGVSRTFLYEHSHARRLVEAAASKNEGRRIEDLHTEQAVLEAAWKQRALNAEDALKAAHHEIRTQRDRIGELLGQVRDLQTHWTEQDLIRVVDDNNRLKKQVRQLTSENNDLKNKLSAARDNARFAEKRISVLEAEYATAAL